MKILNRMSVIVTVVAVMLGVTGLVIASAATMVNLGTADNFAVLAGAGITVSGAVNTTTIAGDIGTFPTASITGIENVVLSGINHVGDATTQGAKTDLAIAYTAAGQAAATVPTELGGGTKNAGVYDSLSGTFEITGTLTLDAEGDPNAVFIFRTGTTLVTAGASNIDLINGAQACNVFWQVGSSATLGASSFFKGNILALTSASLGLGANVEGRVLARDGAVTLDTNTITKATCVVPPTVPSGGGSPSVPLPVPLIGVIKVPTPLALPSGPGSVTYDYTVSNLGTVPINRINVTDNKCDAANLTFVSGDINDNEILEVNEIWKYRCTTALSETTTNTVTAKGEANSFIAIDTANATVVVGSPLVPPLIHLVKKPSVFVLPIGGGTVTYTYTVTNPGTAPLSNVSVVDDKCTGLPGRVIGHPGDLNGNNMLESNETWSFTCQTNLLQTTTNIGTAEGHANGLTAIDFAPAMVAVVTPTLPNTGLSLEEGNVSSGTVVISSVLMLALAALGIALKKRTN